MEILFLLGFAVLLLLVVFIGWIVMSYNSLVVLRNRIENAWSTIDIQLKKRFNLIPNLVETVKGYAKHEKGTFEMVTKARASMANASSVKEKADASNMLTGALKTLFAVSENYPDLKANQNFLMLQEELSSVESKVAYARQFYNDTVLRFNNTVMTFPSNLIAGIFGFKRKDFFEVEDETQKEVPKVSF